MNKLIFRTITEESALEEVLDKVENYSGVRLPIAYARRNKIVGAFLHNKLVAGYMVVTKPEFRSLMFVPSGHESLKSLSAIDNYDMMEINGLWLSPAVKTPILQAKVWFHLIKDIFLSKKKYVLLMRNRRNKNMERFLNMANPTELYSGPPMLMAGDASHENIQVSYTTRWKVVLNSHKYIAEIRNRMKRASEFEKSRVYTPTIDRSEVGAV